MEHVKAVYDSMIVTFLIQSGCIFIHGVKFKDAEE